MQVSDCAKDLIRNLLVYDPNKRLGNGGFREIREHAYFEGIDWYKVKSKKYSIKEFIPKEYFQ
jgi:hypothetical protein